MPIKDNSFIGNLLSESSQRKNSKTRRGRASSCPAWKDKLVTPEIEQDEKFGPTKFRRDHTSIWTDVLPDKRYKRRLSSSKVGLSGGSPTFVEIRGPSPTREQRCKDEIAMKLEMGTVEDLWAIWMQSSAWHQDDGAKWPVQNLEFVKVRKRIASLLKQKMKRALETDKAEDMEAAVRLADGKVQLLLVHGNNKFPELDQILERLEMKQEEQRRAIKGLAESSAPTMVFSDRDKARQSLAEALQAADIEEISLAISKSVQGGLDVTEATRHVGITSKYFAPEGERATGLFAPDCFKGEDRHVDIVNMGPEMDLGRLERLLALAGVKMKYHTDPNGVLVGKEDRLSGSRKGTSVAAALAAQELKVKSKAMLSPHLHTIVLISGPEPARLEGDTGTLEKLVQFNKAGGGIMIIGSGNRGGNTFPLVRDANLILQVLNLEKMWGHDAAARVLAPQSSAGRPGVNAAHPLLADIPQLDEGFSITGLGDSLLMRGFRELVRASNGKLLTCIREPSKAFAGEEGVGPICIHASPTQLLCSKDATGAEQWVTNLLLYMCLRKDDVEEVYVP